MPPPRKSPQLLRRRAGLSCRRPARGPSTPRPRLLLAPLPVAAPFSSGHAPAQAPALARLRLDSLVRALRPAGPEARAWLLAHAARCTPRVPFQAAQPVPEARADLPAPASPPEPAPASLPGLVAFHRGRAKLLHPVHRPQACAPRVPANAVADSAMRR